MVTFLGLNLKKLPKISFNCPMISGLIIVIAHFSFGNLDKGECSIKEGQGIDFSFHDQNFVRTANKFDSSCGFMYSACCIDPMFDSVDISYFNTNEVWDDFFCCGGNITGFRSSDTIWTIKDISRVNFSHKLPVSDTSLFGLGNKSDSCKIWIATTNADAGDCSNCYRPYHQPPYFIIKTRLHKYVLLKIVSQNSSLDPITDKRIYTARIYWYLQSDGSLNFNDISLGISRKNIVQKSGWSFSAPNKIVYMWPGKNISPGSRFFDCCGREIKTAVASKARQYQILIQRNK